MINDDKNNDIMLDKQQLWNKAGSDEHIRRADVGVRSPEDNSGVQSLNEGYLGVASKFTLGEELSHNGGE